ncbi:MAG TPA: acetyl-CoA C-acetyltransferase, partial [Devosia sp.]|nr:acetyl-CoA C-acetyltransferase [Devosia sp.]
MTKNKSAPENIVFVSAKRSPIGTLGGELSPLQAHEIGGQLIAAVMEDARLGPTDICETIMGQVLTAGAGMNPARQAAKIGGIADEAPAMGINQVCGSGMRALALAAQQIQVGAARIVVAGGQESMSNAPHVAPLRKGKKLGDIALVDSAMHDGLTDAFYGYPMGTTAENIAKLYNITREQQDAFALASQQKASAATKANRLKNEIVPIGVGGRAGDIVVEFDQHIRHDADAQSLT